jgi:asparagine synthase (glutamine-hydrolysing)
LKAVLAHPSCPREIDAEAVHRAFSFGWVFGDVTWVRGVRLLPPRSLTVVDREGMRTEETWTWSKIRPIPESSDRREVVRELTALLKRSVEVRCGDERIGVFLSGGLDSRAVAAAVPRTGQGPMFVTFGIPGCQDHEIARSVAAVRRDKLEFFALGRKGWLPKRLPWVVASDGFMNMIHCHAAEDIERIGPLFDYCFSRALGDGVFGGGHLIENNEIDTLFDRYLMRNPMTVEIPHVREQFKKVFERIGSGHALYVEQRNHRAITADTFWKSWFFIRYPFADNALQELLAATPISWRRNVALYKEVLLEAFPEYYRDIPWQRTNVPVSSPDWLADLTMKYNRYSGRVRGLLNRMKIPVRNLRNYQDYAEWLRAPDSEAFVRALLAVDDARYASITQRGLVTRLLEEHFARRKSHPDEIGMALAFEVMARWIDGTLDEAAGGL